VQKIPLTKSTLEYIPSSKFDKKIFKTRYDGVSSFLLNTDPIDGSFSYHFDRRTSPYENLGISIIEK
jgi:hypothetical protein